MATKGSNATAKSAAPKPAARATKPAAPKAKVAAPKAEKLAPVVVPEVVAPVAATPEPVPAVASQAQAAAAETATIVEAAGEAAEKATVEETVIMQNTIENNTAKAQAMFADFNSRTKAAVEKSTKLVEEANDFAKGNLEAVVESSRIAAKGLESLGQDAAEYGRKSFESATSAMKTLASVKSPTDFFKLQSDFVRGAFDAYVAEASKNTEAMLKLAGDAAQPLSNRFAVAAEKVKTAA